MERNIAELIGTKAKALKHCEKLIRKIEKANGEPIKIPLSCTGVVLEAREGSPLHLQIKSISAKLAEEINALQISVGLIDMDAHANRQANVNTEDKPRRQFTNRTVMSEEEIKAHEKAKRREYNKRYYEKKKAQKLAINFS